MNILLACAAGMSTSLLEKALQDYMAENGIEGNVIAHSVQVAKEKIGEFEVVLLGPQVRFMLKEFQKAADEFSVPVAVIAPADYALAKATPIYKQAEELIANK